MKILFRSIPVSWELVEEDFTTTSVKKALEKTRFALDVAYAGFNDAVEPDLIDSYIYEINALQKKYKYLSELAAKEALEEDSLNQISPIRALVSQVFG